MFFIRNNKYIIKEVQYQLPSKFDMKDLSVANFILGMEIRRDHANKMTNLKQIKYVEMILQRFNMQESKLAKVPIPLGVNLSID